MSKLMKVVAGTGSWGTETRGTLFTNFSGADPPKSFVKAKEKKIEMHRFILHHIFTKE